MKTEKVVLAVLVGGVVAALLVTKGHYLVRYAWLNCKSKPKDWTPLYAPLPIVRHVDWFNKTPSLGRKLLMLQSYTNNIAPYADLSAKINARYCKQHGYQFSAIVADKPASPRNPCWDKVYYILQQFKYQGVDWIFWIDSDAIVSDFDKALESIIASAPATTDLFICTSIYLTKNINTGAMLIRMTPWMHKFLQDWWDWSNDRWHQEMCHEQSALDEMLAKDVDMIRSQGKIALFECDEFNSTYQHKGLNVHGKFIQHYRGCSTAKRVEAFSKDL